MTMAICSLAILIITIIIVIPIGNYGYLNASDVLIMITSSLFEPSIAMLVAAIPTSLADIINGYGYYALYTFFIKGLEGYMISFLTRKKWNNNLVMLISGLIVLIGYGLADAYRYGSISLVLVSMERNAPQVIIAVIAGLILNPLLKEFKKKLMEWGFNGTKIY